jgi:arylsulfatase A-like enzyme
MRFTSLAVALFLCALPGLAAGKLNVIMIAADDMRPQIGCYGDAVVKTPHLDRLAARGMVFERAYCQQALCSPSRISLLSGRRPSTTKIDEIERTLRTTMAGITTLPQHFKNSGYVSRSLGKIYHVGIDDPASWSVPPWHSNKPRYGPEGEKAVRIFAEQQKASGKKEPEKGPGRSSYARPAFEAPDVSDGALLDGDTAREAAATLKELAKNPNQPFFLAVGLLNPHVPWVTPRKYWDLFRAEDLKIPENDFLPRGAPSFATTTGNDFRRYAGVPEGKLPHDYARQCLHGYLAAISYVDAQVGLLLDEVDRLGLKENTVIVFWGDHGYYMGEHSGWGSKHNNYEGTTRAPLIVSTPTMKAAGRKTKALVEFVGIYPSLVELCGLPPATDADEWEGSSFKPLLDDPQRTWKKRPLASTHETKGKARKVN